MRTGRLPFGVIGAFLLIGLVGLLGSLQYRWLGQVSEAEREQLRRSLEQRAREFGDDFDGEISRLYLALQMRREALEAGDWTTFAAGVEQWRTSARFPRLVRGIYLAEASTDSYTLRPYDPASRGFAAATDWPKHLEKLRGQLAAGLSPPTGSPNGPRFASLALLPILPEIPALVVPVARHTTPGDGGPAALALDAAGACVVADLDADSLHRTLVPALVARHFPDQGSDAYRVAVLTAAGVPVFTRGFPSGARVDPAHADLVSPFFSLRIDTIREVLAGGSQRVLLRPPVPAPGSARSAQVGERVAVFVEHRESPAPGAQPGASVTGQIRVVRPGWRLVLAHASGSLDTAVARARRRNRWLGFGILGVLAAGVVMVMVNGRRAGRLAAQQMDFVATVSHELRTPLAVIRSAAQNLSAGVVSEPERARRYGELIEQEGRRLTEMVEQVLEYARISGGPAVSRRDAIDLGALARSVAESCQPLCEAAGVELEVCAEAPGTCVAGDEAALRRTLHNLITNALKHGADGRWIGLRVERADGRRGPEVRVEVSDRGRGIDAADLGRVFEPFFRGRRAADEQVHGNGLGLSLVKRVVEAHGGRVAAQSAPGQGASFTIHLPVLAGGDRA